MIEVATPKQSKFIDDIDIFDAIIPDEINANDYLGVQLETVDMPSGSRFEEKRKHQSLKIHLKAQKKNDVKAEHLQELLPRLPEQGWSYHIISSGNFDFWNYVPHLIKLAGQFNEFYCSTWTMNRPIAVEILKLYDAGKLKKISLMTGKYFKRRETAVYAFILDGLLARGQRYIAFSNHTKIMLLGNSTIHLTLEGSANLTANPRAEQFILTNSKNLYAFHRKWMEGMYGKGTIY